MIPLIVCYYFFLLFVIRHLCLYLYYRLFYVYPCSLSITLFFLYPSHPFLHSYLQIYIYMHGLTPCTILVPILSCYIISYPIISYQIISYPIISYHVISYPITSYHAMIALTFQEAIHNAGCFFKTHSGEHISTCCLIVPCTWACL